MTDPWLPMDELTAPPPRGSRPLQRRRGAIASCCAPSGRGRRGGPDPRLGLRSALGSFQKGAGWPFLPGLALVAGGCAFLRFRSSVESASDQGVALQAGAGTAPRTGLLCFGETIAGPEVFPSAQAFPEAEAGRSQRREAPDPGRSVGDVTSGNLALFPLHLGFSSGWSLHTSQKLQIALRAHPGRDIAELWRPEPGLYPSLQVVASK